MARDQCVAWKTQCVRIERAVEPQTLGDVIRRRFVDHARVQPQPRLRERSRRAGSPVGARRNRQHAKIDAGGVELREKSLALRVRQEREAGREGKQVRFGCRHAGWSQCSVLSAQCSVLNALSAAVLATRMRMKILEIEYQFKLQLPPFKSVNFFCELIENFPPKLAVKLACQSDSFQIVLAGWLAGRQAGRQAFFLFLFAKCLKVKVQKNLAFFAHVRRYFVFLLPLNLNYFALTTVYFLSVRYFPE